MIFGVILSPPVVEFVFSMKAWVTLIPIGAVFPSLNQNMFSISIRICFEETEFVHTTIGLY